MINDWFNVPLLHIGYFSTTCNNFWRLATTPMIFNDVLRTAEPLHGI